MRGYYNVLIDYDALGEYLLANCDPDAIVSEALSFERVRKLLADQADGMLDLDPGSLEDVALTEILLEHYWIGVIDHIVVTSVPGVVVMARGQKLILPLVIIKLRH